MLLVVMLCLTHKVSDTLEQPAILAEEHAKRSKEREINAKQKLSEAGAKGAKVKNQLTDELKEWALERAKVMRASDRDISRKLAAQVPAHLLEVSKAPERLIYDALRTRKKLD
jgi:hypothetical protein